MSPAQKLVFEETINLAAVLSVITSEVKWANLTRATKKDLLRNSRLPRLSYPTYTYFSKSKVLKTYTEKVSTEQWNNKTQTHVYNNGLLV